MATASDHAAAPPVGNYLFCSGGQLRIMEIREAASPADRKTSQRPGKTGSRTWSFPRTSRRCTRGWRRAWGSPSRHRSGCLTIPPSRSRSPGSSTGRTAWRGRGQAAGSKVFAVVRDFYDNAFFTEGNIFGSLWDDVRYDVCDVSQKKERKKCQQAVNKDFLDNPPAIKKIRSFPKMDSEDRMNCVILPFPLCQMSLALHTYLSTVAKFPLELRLKYGGGVVKATGIVPYKANNLFQESRGIYVTVDLLTAQSEAPPSKKRKNSSSTRVVALSVHGVEACESTPDPVRRFLDDITELMEGEDGMCVLKSRFQAVHCLLPRNKRRGGPRLKFVKRPELINRDFLKELAGNY